MAVGRWYSRTCPPVLTPLKTEMLTGTVISVIIGLGEPLSTDVQLNAAHGFQALTVCQCDLVFLLDKRQLHSGLGAVSWERQPAIKSKLKETLRI